MKKHVFLLTLVVISFHLINASNDSDRIAQKLSNAAPKAFGSFKMFDKPINQQGLQGWNAVITEGINLFERANKSGNKTVNNYAMRINKANSDLINGIKNVYNSMFLPFVNELHVSFEDIQNNLRYKAQFSELFSTIKDDMTELKKELGKSGFLKSSVQEKDILVVLADYISNYADNAMSSIDYKLSAEKKFSMNRSYLQ